MIEFANTWVFYLLPAPILIRLLPVYRQYLPHVRSPLFQHLVDQQVVKPQGAAWVNTRTPVQVVMLVIMWLSVICAVARPQWIDEPLVVETPSRDLLVVVDISGSMATQDGADGNSRLAVVKRVLTSFSDSRQGDRLGLIVFADKPYIQAPLSADLQTWNQLLQRTVTGPAGQNTAIGDALGLALQHFEHSSIDEKVVLLLTDGSDNRSLVPPQEAALIAKQRGVRIFSVAIGSQNNLPDAPVDLDTLQAIASLSGGQFYRADDEQGLIAMRDAFDKQVPAAPQRQWIYPRHELYMYPLFVTLMITGFTVVVSLLRRREANHE